jgi:hypothetical protein
MLYTFAVARGRSFLARQRIGNDAEFRFDRRFRRFFDDHRRLSFKSKSLRRTGRRTRAAKQRRVRFSLNLLAQTPHFRSFARRILITLSYYAAYVLLFGPIEESAETGIFLKKFADSDRVEIFAFLFVGVYRGIWRYTSVGDFVTFTKGVALGSILSILAILLFYRFQYFSRTVFVLTVSFCFSPSSAAGWRFAFSAVSAAAERTLRAQSFDLRRGRRRRDGFARTEK